MIFSALVPTRWRRNYDITDPNKPGYYNRQITPYLQIVSNKACTHPLNTISAIAILASCLYVNLLGTGFFQPSVGSSANKVDLAALSAGSRILHVGPETSWKWQTEEQGIDHTSIPNVDQDISLVTLEFPNSHELEGVTPTHRNLRLPSSGSAQLLPSTAKFLAPATDSALVYALPRAETAHFLASVSDIPVTGPAASQEDNSTDDEPVTPIWHLRNSRKAQRSNGLVDWARNSWSAFWELVKNAETLDIIIMSLGYLSMYLTFISLFASMRRLGSNFWLATTVLFSSAFAFLFGLIVTLKLGVPENVVLLSEGVPFLVVTIGFEKPIVLTQAVLSASLAAKKPSDTAYGESSPTIQNAVQIAVRERGFEIVRDYLVEIAILVIGAASGIQGGLQPFCFLAAWTLFFDCILLFTFYTSILTIKLEVNRIKRHVAIRKALEEDGVSRKVAERVASSNDWPKDDKVALSSDFNLFGRKIRESSVPRFKVLMVSGFVLVNILNLCTVPFRTSEHAVPIATAGLSSVVTQPPVDPFKVARNGLEEILNQAKISGQSTAVTVFLPLKYELEHPALAVATVPDNSEVDYASGVFGVVGGHVVDSLLKSFEDPVLSKWVIIALAMSLVLNGYLFNAARWTIKEATHEQRSHVHVAERPSEAAKRSPPHLNGHVGPASEDSAAGPGMNGAPNNDSTAKRSREECESILAAKQAPTLNDAELTELAVRGKIPGYALEKTLGDMTRAVKIRRALISRTPATSALTSKLERSKLPYEHYDYERVHGACCENVIGYLPLPLGVAGPINIDGQSYFLPMATTEGVLVASVSRGCKAINAGGGAITVLTGDGMTRGPCIGFPTLVRAAAAKVWLDSLEGQTIMKDAFNSTSRFARLQQLKTAIAGTYVYVRFKTTTGDAMGMNMISKGVEHALDVMSKEAAFEDMAIITVSGNFCTDKKPAAINWIDGRGKSVVAEAIIPADVVRSVLKSNVDALVELNISKNLIGSAMAGSIGGFNAQASNIVSAIFLATGQDPAQNVESSNCITVMRNYNGNLQISVSMPSIEVGTIGGGTILEPQAAMLDLLGVRGPHPTSPGANAQQLARIVAAGVMAGELSLCSALAAGHLVRAHMAHNRSAAPSAAPSRSQSPGPGGPSSRLVAPLRSVR